MSDKPLRGRLALVTGGAQGIGAAIARRLASDGADVGVNDLRDGDALAEVVAETGGFPVIGDITDPDVAAMVDAVETDRRRPVDILVCNAAYMTMAPFDDDDEDDWWKVVDTNLAGTFRLIQAVLPGMRRAGGGNVVVIASEWGVIGWPGASAYSASKAGLIALTKTLGRELARENITVNAIAPGVVDTPQLLVDAEAAGVSLAEMHRRYGADIPMGRIGRPGEIASAAALLARADVGALVGQTLQINGGSTRCRV
ncbi:3-oxoacyl-ACP reductase [Mycolicibacterium madagascariense]|uniref:3-oxoacyl-[acyl-carrier-protein] reductase MabA n=1 Tax=Mycolicibacterium madagascariense TaxID=212765 RepID=A0A7I7XDL5_9MYCO|nr:SDR family oxidoreductase [Mycolicibacterium madagascariense]MCV7013603.1 SDR family oxidoreductase [Mycolicibacterium madagascariense]BBZ27053.1 3-oxoacyl-ACP reductase [Mycolicibacterium madagascariense]